MEKSPDSGSFTISPSAQPATRTPAPRGQLERGLGLRHRDSGSQAPEDGQPAPASLVDVERSEIRRGEPPPRADRDPEVGCHPERRSAKGLGRKADDGEGDAVQLN